MRVTVGMIVGQIGEGVSSEELLSDYPYLEKEDIMQALRYAAALSQWIDSVHWSSIGSPDTPVPGIFPLAISLAFYRS
jgi:hypothetical protein